MVETNMARKKNKRKPMPIKTKSTRLDELWQQAQISYQSGGFSAARALCLQLHDAKPRHTKALYMLGLLANKEKDFPLAIQYFQQILTINNNHIDARNHLANVLKAQQKFDRAIEQYKILLQIKPDHLEAHNNLALTFASKGETTQAKHHFNCALALAPESGVIHFNFANFLTENNQENEAIMFYEKSITLDPTMADAYNNLGNIYLKQGNMAKAKWCFENVLQLNPYETVAYRHLLWLSNDVPGIVSIDNMLQLLTTRLAETEAMQIHFALFKAYENERTFDNAFLHLHKANTIKRRTIKYTIDNDIHLIERIIHLFTQENLRDKLDKGCQSNQPIFIIGMPRSGTSLVEQILASHSDVYGAGESEALKQVVHQSAQRLGNGLEYPEYAITIDNSSYLSLADMYLKNFGDDIETVAHFTDKMPSNFLYVGMIKLLFPNAIIIHCVRDPIDTCLSCYKHLFNGKLNFAYDLKELAKYHQLYQALMQHWHQIFPGAILDLQYEDLVNEQEKMTTMLLQHCQLAWETSCIEFYKNKRHIHTASALQVKKPIYKTSIGHWRNYEKHLQPLIDTLLQ